jgi:DNA helicase HerA-like ATPase
MSYQAGRNAYNPMIVAGSSGVGKSYFVCYFIYRLLHPDGDLLQSIPDTIIWKPQPNNANGHIYHHGHFYTCGDLD